MCICASVCMCVLSMCLGGGGNEGEKLSIVVKLSGKVRQVFPVFPTRKIWKNQSLL